MFQRSPLQRSRVIHEGEIFVIEGETVVWMTDPDTGEDIQVTAFMIRKEEGISPGAQKEKLYEIPGPFIWPLLSNYYSFLLAGLPVYLYR